MSDLNSIGGIHYEMMKRCYNEKSIMWNTYGAKGITVCDEWHDRNIFRTWASENGYKKGLRLQRKDSNIGYVPDNCYFGEKYKDRGVSKAYQIKKSARRKIMEECGTIHPRKNERLSVTHTSMYNRCTNKKHDNYKNYGGRGIKMCDEWSGKYGYSHFFKWANENGYIEGLTIDRIDVNGNYCPENCRFITMAEQSRNRRNTINIIYKGNKIILADLKNIFGINTGKIRKYIDKQNMEVDDLVEKYLNGCLK